MVVSDRDSDTEIERHRQDRSHKVTLSGPNNRLTSRYSRIQKVHQIGNQKTGSKVCTYMMVMSIQEHEGD